MRAWNRWALLGGGLAVLLLAGCTFVFFLVAAFWLPETKGRSLEEIEAGFAGKQR